MPTDVENQIANVFDYEGIPVRTLVIDGSPWFVAKDVCRVLELAKVDRAIARLDGDEKDAHTVSTPGGDQEMSVINESGLYSLIMTSRKKEARQFRRWVTHEVLPEIRNNGSYNVPALPTTYLQSLKALVIAEEERERLAQENLLMAPKADAFDTYLTAGGNISIGDFAKMLGTGQKRLFKFLRQEGILQDGGAHHNVPYQVHIDAGRFKLRALTIERTDPLQSFNKVQPLITPKGMEYVSLIWNGRQVSNALVQS